MERLSAREVSNIPPQDIALTDIDIDLYSVNYCVNHANFGANMALMLGPNVMLSSKFKRNYPSTPFLATHAFPITYHPSVMLIRHHGHLHILKQQICSHLRDLGQMVFPAGQHQDWLICGTDKGVPTLVLVLALIRSGIQYVRVLHFGTKMPYSVFPIQEEIVRGCDAVNRGVFKENQYHISINVHNRDILAAKVEHPQLCGRQTIHPTFIPLDMRRNPQNSIGGTFTMAFHEGPIKEIKWYNLIYHVLRGLSQKKLQVPTQSNEQVARFIESWADIKERLATNAIHLGGYRIETLIENRTVEGTARLYIDQMIFRVNELIQPSLLHVHQISVANYLQLLDGLFDLGKANLAKMGAMRGHRTSIPVTKPMKKVMGDLKSLLGYSVHKTPHTSFSDASAWWKRQPIAVIDNPPPQQPQQWQARRNIRSNERMDIFILLSINITSTNLIRK